MFPRYILKGSPFEVGYQHGHKAKSEVNRCISNYQLFFQMMGMSWENVLLEAQKYIEPVKRHFPETLEEMEGIAKGAEVDFDSILMINCRSEIFSSAGCTETEGCTAYAVAPNKTTGVTYIGQNWDYFDPHGDTLILLEIEQNHRPKILMITEAGIVGKIGLNSSGVGIAMNALSVDRVTTGVPVHIVMRGVLNSESLNTALNTVAASNVASAVNFVIGHHQTGVVNMEIIPGCYDLSFPDRGFVVHTNHLISERLLRKVNDLNRIMLLDSFIRLNRAYCLFSQADVIDLDTLKAIQSDHLNYPQSICRHLVSDDPTQLVSIFALALDLKNKVMHLAAGQPCQSDFDAISLTGYLQGSSL